MLNEWDVIFFISMFIRNKIFDFYKSVELSSCNILKKDFDEHLST